MAIWTVLAKEQWQPRIAVAICTISAVWGAMVVALGTDHIARDVGWVAGAWAGVGLWLEDFRTLRMTPAQIYQGTPQGKLRRSPVHKVIRYGSVLLFALAIICLFR